MPSRESREHTIDGCVIPVHIFYERRRNVRVALGKDSVLLRIPGYCNTRQREQYHRWCDDWIEDQWVKNPRFRATFIPFMIDEIEGIRTSDRTFLIEMVHTPNRSSQVRIRDDVIHLKIPAHWSSKARDTASYQLIHKALADRYLNGFKERVHALHAGQFSKEIVTVRLRNLSSKWGSCSHDGKLSFSTRLLFAPYEVQQYVLLHELCHLDVLNHSREYWSRVASLDPDYKDKERWLRSHGHMCDLKFAIVSPGDLSTEKKVLTPRPLQS